MRARRCTAKVVKQLEAPRIVSPLGVVQTDEKSTISEVLLAPAYACAEIDNLLRLLSSLSPDDQKIVAALAERLAGRGGGV